VTKYNTTENKSINFQAKDTTGLEPNIFLTGINRFPVINMDLFLLITLLRHCQGHRYTRELAELLLLLKKLSRAAEKIQ